MDTSPTYISLCRKAHEIQEQWQQEHGDFFVGEQGRIECWIKGVHDKRTLRQGVRIFSSSGQGVIGICKYVWLPKLDQLIELAQIPGRRYELITQDFFDWTRQDYGLIPGEPRRIFKSLEQVWLAFVMQQQFGKCWSGRRWRSLTSE